MLEILLAMTVLMIIMMMLTTIFDQSANTWESGMRETSRALEGRTIMNLIAGDLELAVMSPALYAANEVAIPLEIGPGKLCFYYYDEADVDARALKAVKYAKSGSLQRTAWDLVSDGVNPYSPQLQDEVDLLDNVKSFKVFTPGDAIFTTNLPEWVDIELELTETANAASDIQVWSFGPDRVGGGGDDVVE